MGGRTSGNWNRCRSHRTIETVPEIRISCLLGAGGEIVAIPRDELRREMQLFHYLRSGNTVLLFSKSPNDEPENPVAVTIDSTRCNFGGVRYWLRCPNKHCGRRVQSLFVSGGQSIACRKCHGLYHESQYGGEIDLALTRLRKYQRLVGRGASNRKVDVAKMCMLFSEVLAPLEKIARGNR